MPAVLTTGSAITQISSLVVATTIGSLHCTHPQGMARLSCTARWIYRKIGTHVAH